MRHALCAEKVFATCAAPKFEFAPRRAPNFYEIDPWPLAQQDSQISGPRFTRDKGNEEHVAGVQLISIYLLVLLLDIKVRSQGHSLKVGQQTEKSFLWKINLKLQQQQNKNRNDNKK